MAVRQDDNRYSWRMLQAALVMILCRDERRLPRKLRRRILQWMQRSPDNLVYLFEIARIDQALGELKLLDCSTHLSRPKPRPQGLSFVTRRAALLGGAAVVALALGISLLMSSDDSAVIQHLALEDGTQMHVLRGADFDIEFTEHSRLIKLSRGEAVFEVAKDPERPFIVRTPESDSIAVGTRYGVVTDSSGTTTTVSEGEVRVVTPAGAAAAGTRVRAGQEIKAVAGAPRLSYVVAVDANRKVSWSAGWLEFDGETVGQAAKTFNRFSDVRIEITQPEISNARLTYYRFSLDKPESFAVAIGGALDAPVTRDPAGKVIYVGEPK